MQNTTRKVERFTDLMTWQESHQAVLSIYRITKKFPKDELFGLTSQVRRSAVSITSNIAEGFGRHTFKDKVHFYYQARGSMTELRNQLIISKDISYISDAEYKELETRLDNAQRLLHGLINKTAALA
jgi:four helix bundle protein